MPLPEQSYPRDIGTGQTVFLMFCGVWFLLGISAAISAAESTARHGYGMGFFFLMIWIYTLPFTLLPLAIGTVVHGEKYFRLRKAEYPEDASLVSIYGGLTTLYLAVIAYHAF
jgi:hypothetical protein